MIRSLWSAATGMQAQTLNIDIISNNLANASTTGFKRDRAVFSDLIYQNIVQVVVPPPVGSLTTPLVAVVMRTSTRFPLPISTTSASLPIPGRWPR